MSGIFDQLPDISVLENLRDLSQAGFQEALNKTPKTPADLLGSLPDGLAALLGAIPTNPATLTQELTTFFHTVQDAAGLDLADAIQTVANGLTQVRNDVTGSPLGALVLAPGEGRELKDILLAQATTFITDFLADVTNLRDSLLASEQVQLLLDFVDAIEAFTNNLPDNAAEIVDFLAQSFTGLPSDLLAATLAVVDPVLAQFEQMANTAAAVDVQLHVQGLSGQLSAAAHLITVIDLNVASSYQAAIAQLTLTQGAFTALTGSLQSAFVSLNSGLAAIHLDQFTANFGAALAAIPTLNVAGLDEIKVGLLSPLQALIELLSTLTPEAFVGRVQLALTTFNASLKESSLAEWQTTILGFFETVKNFIAQIDLSSIRTQIDAAFATINQRIADLGANFKQTLIDALRSVLTTIEGAFDALDFTAVETLINNVFDQLNAALAALSVTDLQNQLSTAFSTLDGVITGLVTQTTAIANQLHDIITSVGQVQFDTVTQAVIAEIEKVTAALQKIDPASLSTAQRLALTAAVGVLKAVNFQETITDVLVQRCRTVAELPRAPLETVAARLDTLFTMIRAFDPEELLAPLSALYQQMTQPLNSLQASTLIQPLKDVVATVQAGFDRLSPAQLRAPLEELFTSLLARLDVLSPTALLAPVSAVFTTFEDALHKVDLTALLDELSELLDNLFAQAKSTILDHIQGLGLPKLATDLLASLTPVLDLLSPALLVDPVNKFVEVLDNVSANFNPGQLLAPLRTLHDQVIALLQQVADDVLVAGFEQVRQTLVTALHRVDPALLAGQINGLIQEVTTFYAALNPAPLVTVLNSPYQAITAAFAALNPATVPPALQGLFDQLRALVTGLNPAPALNALQSGYATGQERLTNLGTVALDTLVDAFTPIRVQMNAVIPDFLTRPVTVESLTAALAELRLDALVAELDAAYATVKGHFTTLRPTLVTELERFRNEQENVLLFLDFHALAAKFQDIYEAIVAQISALNPATIIADLQSVFDTIRTTIVGLNPTFLVDELTATFDQLKAKLNFTALDTLESQLAGSLQSVRDKVAQLDPVALLRAAGVLETFAKLQTALTSVSVANVVADLDKALSAICDELASELNKTQTAFEQMIDAIPTVDVGAGLGL